MTRVAINGFGRIGRTVAKLILKDPKLKLVGINDLHSPTSLAHLFKYDSVHGQWQGTVSVEGEFIVVDGHPFNCFAQSDPSELPWQELGVDVVVEATGKFKTRADLEKHLTSGAKKVILSVPPVEEGIPMVVMGVNDHVIKDTVKIISNASCTTNSAAHMIALLDELCEIDSCYITTVHSYTGDQRLHDAPHRDLRRARAASQSIIPTTTGAAKALTSIFPHLNDKMGGCGIRVPVPDGSLTDITCLVNNPLSENEINAAFKSASQGRFKGFLSYCEDPIVSVDVLGRPESCIYDSLLTSVIGKMVKLVGWYDNETGYSNRLVDLIHKWHPS
jgi:glyceraldehyde 3-phosphate dehydrogenase